MNPRRVFKEIAKKTQEQVALLRMSEKLQLLLELLTTFTALFKEMRVVTRPHVLP